MHDKIFLSLSPNQMNKLNYFSPKKSDGKEMRLALLE